MKPKKLVFENDFSGKRLPEVDRLLQERWGSVMIVSRGKIADAGLLPKFIARDLDGKLMGLVTFRVDKENSSCEVVSLDALVYGQGIGSKLLAEVEMEAKKTGCRKIWLITLNDNPEAATFYIKRGYRLTAVHLDALSRSRDLKPQLPLIGRHEVHLRDEWEFEKFI